MTTLSSFSTVIKHSNQQKYSTSTYITQNSTDMYDKVMLNITESKMNPLSATVQIYISLNISPYYYFKPNCVKVSNIYIHIKVSIYTKQ